MTEVVTDKIVSCFYDSSEDCVKVVDSDGILMSFNENGLKIMEIDTSSDVVGKSWLSFWKGDLEQPSKAAFEQALSGTPSSFEGYCPTFKGTMKYWYVSIVPLTNDDGTVSSVLVTSRDKTKEIDLEKKVAALEAKVSELTQQ